MKTHDQASETTTHTQHYRKLLLMTVFSFIAMYILMYAMVNSFSNIFMNVNQFYMAGLMASPMIIIELVVMSSMYLNKKLNTIFMVISVGLMILFYVLIRQQIAVGDKQFLRSMIPHHAGAILMCEKADIKDPEIKKLCEQIHISQQAEIEEMKAKLRESER